MLVSNKCYLVTNDDISSPSLSVSSRSAWYPATILSVSSFSRAGSLHSSPSGTGVRTATSRPARSTDLLVVHGQARSGSVLGPDLLLACISCLYLPRVRQQWLLCMDLTAVHGRTQLGVRSGWLSDWSHAMLAHSPPDMCGSFWGHPKQFCAPSSKYL